MATLIKSCSMCEGVVTFTFGTTCRHGELYWSGSERCNNCSHAIELDAKSAPEDLRQLEIDLDGLFCIKSSSKVKVSRIYNIIRKFFDLSIHDIRLQAGNSDGIFYKGTEGEAELIKYHAEHEGLSCEVFKL